MILSFHPCFDSDVQVILGDRPLDSDDFALIRRAEAIILPQGCPVDLYEACGRSSALIFPSYETRFRYPGKIGQSNLFKDLRCPHPETATWPTVKQFKEAFPVPGTFPHELPFFIKSDVRHEGEGIYIVEDKATLSEALERLACQERTGLSGFLTQAYVPSKGNVLRVVIIGKRFSTYWKRPLEPGQVITTISNGATIDHYWRPDLREKGVFQAQALSRSTGLNLAAIDFVFSLSETDPGPLFLEINYYFARRGLGGTVNYYHLLHRAIKDWLVEAGLDPKSVRLV